MVLLAAALVAGLLVAGCQGTISGVTPSRTPISLPTRSPHETSAAQPTAQEPATSAAAESPAASSSSGSNLIWLWIVLGALVLIGIIVLVARSGRRGPKPGEVWQARAVDAYAKGSALHDAMQMAEAPGALVAQDAAARWADIQRRADDLAQRLYAMRESAPDEDERARVADTLGALQAVRSAMDAERAPGGADPRQAEVVRGRLYAFDAALRALRPPDPTTRY